MKVVMFTDAYWPRINGVTVSVDSFSRSLVTAGHQVLIVCSFYPEEGNAPVPISRNTETGEDPQIVRVPSIPAFITKEDRIPKYSKWYWVFKQVENFDPDIVHINTEMMIAEFGFWYAKTHNLPSIYTFHTMWEDYTPHYFYMFPSFLVKIVTRGILKIVVSRSYRMIVPTPQIDVVVQKYRPKVKTFLLPTGIEPELFDHDEAECVVFREKLEEAFPRLKGKRILLFAGRIGKEKNIGFLLEIFPAILAKHPDAVLLIAGNGPDMDYFKNEARKAGIEDNCVFTGYVERRDLALIYAISEIFVFPSLTDTQGLVTLEAMFSGTPVVAIGAMGTLMVMGGDNGGFMVPNDPGAFTGRVLELLDDPELRRRKSREARTYAYSWSIEELTKKLVEIYQITIQAYREEYGEPIKPVWSLLTDKRWWNINKKIFQRKTGQKWRQMLSKLGMQSSN